MMKKRVLCCLLALVMTLGALTVFSSCAKDGEIFVGFFKKTVDLEGFSLVYGEVSNTSTVSGSFKDQVVEFSKRIGSTMGVSLSVASDQTAKTTSKDKEILIGHTNRDQSLSLLKSIKGHGFAISVKRNKITIVGSNAMMTLHALDYFYDNYLSSQQGGSKVRLPAKIKANNIATLTLADSDGTEYAWVYEEGLDTEPGNKWKEPGANAEYDYPYQVVQSSIEKVIKITALPERFFKKRTELSQKTEHEILIGRPNREEVRDSLAKLPGNGYGLFTIEGKVIVTAWSDSGLVFSSKLFQEMLSDATIEDEQGRKQIVFPQGMSLSGTMQNDWVTDFPKPQGVPLYNTQDAGNSALQYLYKGEGVNADAYHAYYNALLAEGYTLLCENEIEQSLFATFVHEEKGHTLNVSYNAFLHGEGNYDYDPMLRVISTPLSAVNLPGAEILTPNPTYEKKTDSTITAVHLEQNHVGMGYVIMLEDGRFVIFDGGEDSGPQGQRLYDILASLHTKVTGEEPSTKNPIQIAAWFITHSHSDHYDVFTAILNQYMTEGLVKLEYLMGNYPSSEVAYNAAGTDMLMTNMAMTIEKSYGVGKFVKIHTGQKYYFANLEIEVLCTQEDLNPVRLDLFNDTSSTVRFTMRATDAQGKAVDNKEATVTSIWTGDTFIYGSRFMSAMYGPYLESDMVQVAHHGNIGAEAHFYGNVKPTVVWFPHLYWSYRYYTSGKSSDWQNQVDYYLVHELGTVKYVYISDARDTTLTLTVDGPDYDGIYDAITGRLLNYGSHNAIKK